MGDCPKKGGRSGYSLARQRADIIIDLPDDGTNCGCFIKAHLQKALFFETGLQAEDRIAQAKKGAGIVGLPVQSHKPFFQAYDHLC
jgi:hypothetical protein